VLALEIVHHNHPDSMIDQPIDLDPAGAAFASLRAK
jgi:hypothetical protein